MRIGKYLLTVLPILGISFLAGGVWAGDPKAETKPGEKKAEPPK
jgi:hypothetical protein